MLRAELATAMRRTCSEENSCDSSSVLILSSTTSPEVKSAIATMPIKATVSRARRPRGGSP